MRTGTLGNSGLMVSAVGVGCNAFGARVDADGVADIVGTALDAGITFFDTADAYSRGESERLLGAALAGRRDEAIIATKFGMDLDGLNGPDFGARGSRRYIRRAVEASLRRLGTDYIDLYQLHTPDRRTPLEETLTALDDLVRDGLVRYLGCSNMTAWEVVDAHWLAESLGTQPFISAQNEYSLYNRAAEVELVPACLHAGVGLLPYFPLAYGLLTGKYRRGEQAPAGSRLSDDSQASRLDGADFDIIEGFERFAAERGITMLDLAIGGLAAQPGVSSVISGVSKASQVTANAAAAQWEPTPEDLSAIDAIVARGSGASYTTFAT